MNIIAMRRRWLIARPWIKDGLTAICLIIFVVASFFLMDMAAAICTALEYCA